MRMDVERRRRKGRPKRRWMDSINVDFGEKGLSGRTRKSGQCMEATCQKHRPHIEVGKDAVEEVILNSR